MSGGPAVSYRAATEEEWPREGVGSQERASALRPYRVWISIWALTGTVVLLLVATANVIVDPFNLTMLMTRPGLNAEIPALEWESRWSKAAGLIRTHPETLLLGSSVVDAGYDVPGSTRFDAHRLDHLIPLLVGPTAVYNAGIRSGGTEDGIKYLRHALLSTPRLKRVIAGFEWTLFTDLKRKARRFPDSGLLSHRSFVPFGVPKYLSWTALDASARTIQVNQDSERTGGLIDLAPGSSKNWLEFLLHDPEEHPERDDSFAVRARSMEETRLLYFSRFFAKAMLIVRKKDGPIALDRPEALRDIRDMVEFAHERRIPLLYYVSPMHPVFWAYMRATGLWQYHLAWLRELVKITPFYDFAESVDFSGNVDDYFSTDPLHFNRTLGQRLLRFFESGDGFSSPAPLLVTPDNIEEAIARRERALSKWLDANPYVAEVVGRLKPTTGERESVAVSYPRQRPGEHRGFEIIELAHQFYGVPTGEQPYDLLRLLRHDFRPMVVGKSAKDVLGQIDSRNLHGWQAVSADMVAGSAVSSGLDGGRPERAFDGDRETYWVSPERKEAISGNAWVGYAFAQPQDMRRVILTQSTNPPYRQDRVRVQWSQDGGSAWHDALPEPVTVEGATSVINLPETAPASWWRLLAADPAGGKEAWSVVEVEFLVSDARSAETPPLAAIDGCEPIASADGYGSPDHAFDKNSDSFWISAERGTAVKDRAWIGCAFAKSEPVRRILITQPVNPPYRQDAVRVEKSDDGKEWLPALPGPIVVRGYPSAIDLPPASAARFWRLVAAADNAKTNEHAWTVIEIALYRSPDEVVTTKADSN